ncbi:hypothetical protein FIBSPDRAFT_2772 [Athelia psychrophila]|uniref:Uncharacterized protein n=1 Tax=Athelia psychrophila TaxID=1759441 RepID=A0A166WYU5_9AGAM|nr:hypothetical protein FIBSPDRAFT_2772 [Fibularhizoctonia sp. CBS 109695]
MLKRMRRTGLRFRISIGCRTSFFSLLRGTGLGVDISTNRPARPPALHHGARCAQRKGMGGLSSARWSQLTRGRRRRTDGYHTGWDITKLKCGKGLRDGVYVQSAFIPEMRQPHTKHGVQPCRKRQLRSTPFSRDESVHFARRLRHLHLRLKLAIQPHAHTQNIHLGTNVDSRTRYHSHDPGFTRIGRQRQRVGLHTENA